MQSDYDADAIGVDRFLALLAAKHVSSGVRVVADCGTAATVDVLDENDRHTGGVILPGLTMMRRSLRDGTDAVTPSEAAREDAAIEKGKRAALAHDTQDAVEQGCHVALRSSIEDVVRKQQAAEVVITGGDAETVRHADWYYRPHLVLEGLSHYASAAAQG